MMERIEEHTSNFGECFPCVPPAAQFIAESHPGGWSFWNISEADTYQWDFGDLGTSSDPFPSLELENGQDLTDVRDLFRHPYHEEGGYDHPTLRSSALATPLEGLPH